MFFEFKGDRQTPVGLMPDKKSRNSRNGGQRHRILDSGFQGKISRGLKWEPVAGVPDCETKTPHQTDEGN